LIAKGSAEAVSIRGVATAVGVTPPSIYLHFADKDELIFAVCQEQFARLEQLVDEASVGIDDPLERLRTMGETYIRFGVEHPEQYRILLMSKGEVSVVDFQDGTMPGVSTFQKLMGAIEACMDAGVFARQDVFLVATGIWAIVHGITSMRITLPEFPFVGAQVLLDHVFDTYARGLAP
jgi:AcrR family transcriptional regulator